MHGVADSADAIAGNTPSAKGHPVHPERGMVVHHDRSGIEPPDGVECRVQVIGEYGGLKGHVQAVCPPDRILTIPALIYADDGSENLLS